MYFLCLFWICFWHIWYYSKRIYLTFDAGYENGNVEKILDTLKEKNVPAAFFLLEHIITKNTDLVLRMAKEGHTVCNHTTNHKNLSKATKEEIKSNLSSLESTYENLTGLKMAKYFRFPEGRYSEEALAVINELGYKTIFWSFGWSSRHCSANQQENRRAEWSQDSSRRLQRVSEQYNVDLRSSLQHSGEAIRNCSWWAGGKGMANNHLNMLPIINCFCCRNCC